MKDNKIVCRAVRNFRRITELVIQDAVGTLKTGKVEFSDDNTNIHCFSSMILTDDKRWVTEVTLRIKTKEADGRWNKKEFIGDKDSIFDEVLDYYGEA